MPFLETPLILCKKIKLPTKLTSEAESNLSLVCLEKDFSLLESKIAGEGLLIFLVGQEPLGIIIKNSVLEG